MMYNITHMQVVYTHCLRSFSAPIKKLGYKKDVFGAKMAIKCARLS